MKYYLLFLALLLGGCVGDYDSSIRIYKVGASGNYPLVGGVVTEGYVILMGGEAEDLSVSYDDGAKFRLQYGQIFSIDEEEDTPVIHPDWEEKQ